MGFVALFLLSLVLYFVGHHSDRWEEWDWVSVLIPGLAFICWTIAHNTTAFDVIWPALSEANRFAAAVISAVVLAMLAAFFATKADQKTHGTVAQHMQLEREPRSETFAADVRGAPSAASVIVNSDARESVT